MPVVDVIIPAYNAARFLPASLDSVIAQSFPDWRILLVDDGSTDDTPELVRPYQDRLGLRLRYIRQVNAGLPAARNTAIRHSTAEFLALLDADDIWLPQRLEHTLERFHQQPKAGLVYGFNARIDSQGVVLDVFDRKNAHAEGWVGCTANTPKPWPKKDCANPPSPRPYVPSPTIPSAPATCVQPCRCPCAPSGSRTAQLAT